MPEFILDTSGTVPIAGRRVLPNPAEFTRWDQLDAFTQGYIEALFFTENEQGTTREERVTSRGTVRKAWAKREAEGQQKDMPGDYGFSDLAAETLADIVKDCAAFQRNAAPLLARAYARDYAADQAGRDFWFTRNGHGVGFWDRRELKPETEAYERLTAEMVAAGHNTAAWDEALKKRNALEADSLGELLSAAARKHGNHDAYIGGDGKVYVS